LLQAIWVFIPAFRQPPGFDFFVLLAGIALLLLRRSLRQGNRDKSRIDVLTTTGLETLGTEVRLKHLEEISITPTLRSRSLKKATVVPSGMLFITPSPTNSSKERLLFTWNSSSSTASGRLRLRSG